MGTDEDRAAADFFDGSPQGLAICQRVRDEIAALGQASVAVTRSQVSFRRDRGFAYVWRPGRYVRSDVPAVLSIALPHRLDSPRFKSVVHPSTRVWMHHLELADPDEVDDEVRSWLAQAWAYAASADGA